MPKQDWSIVTISTCFQGVLGQLVPTSQKVYLSDNLSLLVKCPRLLRPQCGNLIANVVHLKIRTSIVASLGIDQQPGGCGIVRVVRNSAPSSMDPFQTIGLT